ncbi:unnamed protein product [Vitrella brassicaformis CCMP3155]|uniref:STAS domain-containing protein n=1 Tax=Vitrella brassicaformis (strain CCMP3155) TaxID=1169540 RepID=A0A0G4FYJ9_VITBC|nr:unnamed protein product [Vitrella brassicaformis CCMP3155]|eukprot:CEM20271.1 unnamed protein product [Vitrella brassicaformis CCMP3155]
MSGQPDPSERLHLSDPPDVDQDDEKRPTGKTKTTESDVPQPLPGYKSVLRLGGAKGKGDSLLHVVKGVTWGWALGGWQDWTYWKTEILSGLIICFAQIPESVAFAFMANVDPSVGLHAAWIVGLFATVFGGRPGMINGATGAIAAVAGTFVSRSCKDGTGGGDCEYVYDGVEKLFVSVIVASVLMFVFAFFRLSSLIQLVPTPVMIGFVNGLAIVIGIAQLHPFQDEHTHEWVTGWEAVWMALLCILAMALMEYFPKVPVVGKLVPSSLVAVVASVFFELVIVRQAFGGRTKTIGDVAPFSQETAFPMPFFLNSDYDLDKIRERDSEGNVDMTATVTGIIVQGITLFAVATMESLMTTEVVTDLLKTPGDGDQQVFGMGLGNALAGLLGGMGGNAMIGLSVMNCRNGSMGKESGVVTALGIFVMLVGGYPALNYIPIASLSGIMFVVVLHTFKWYSLPMIVATFVPGSLRKRSKYLKRKIKRWDAIIIIVVTIVVTNLAIAVGIGLCIAALVYAWDSANRMTVECGTVDNTKYYEVKGNIFFASRMRFERLFDFDNDPERVVIVLRNSSLADYSALEAINAVKKEYQERGKEARVKGLTDECVRMVTKAGHLLKHVDLSLMEVDIPRVHRFADYTAYAPGIVIARQSSTMSDASSPRRRSHDFGAGLIQRANKNVTSKNTVSINLHTSEAPMSASPVSIPAETALEMIEAARTAVGTRDVQINIRPAAPPAPGAGSGSESSPRHNAAAGMSPSTDTGDVTSDNDTPENSGGAGGNQVEVGTVPGRSRISSVP